MVALTVISMRRQGRKGDAAMRANTKRRSGDVGTQHRRLRLSQLQGVTMGTNAAGQHHQAKHVNADGPVELRSKAHMA
jgi:hypothetical protein